MNFIKKLTGKESNSSCCGVEIKEVEAAKEESCCGVENEENGNEASCCDTSNNSACC